MPEQNTSGSGFLDTLKGCFCCLTGLVGVSLAPVMIYAVAYGVTVPIRTIHQITELEERQKSEQREYLAERADLLSRVYVASDKNKDGYLDHDETVFLAKALQNIADPGQPILESQTTPEALETLIESNHPSTYRTYLEQTTQH